MGQDIGCMRRSARTASSNVTGPMEEVVVADSDPVALMLYAGSRLISYKSELESFKINP